MFNNTKELEERLEYKIEDKIDNVTAHIDDQINKLLLKALTEPEKKEEYSHITGDWYKYKTTIGLIQDRMVEAVLKTVSDKIITEIKREINSEAFIDSIVKRIKDKQIS